MPFIHVKIVEQPLQDFGLRVGDVVQSEILGRGVVIGFSSISSEPFVFFYDTEKIIGVGWETVTVFQS